MPRFKRDGFTLIELLVVIAIIVILASAAAASSSRTQRNFAFNVQYNDILQIMREARNLAVSNLTVVDTTDFDQDGDTTDKVLPLGYGVKLDKSATPQAIELFMDVPGTVKHQLDPAGTPNDTVIRRLEIDDRFAMTLDEDGASVNQLLLYYEPPFGFANFLGTYKVGHVVLTDKDNSSFSKKVMVHRVAGVPEPSQ